MKIVMTAALAAGALIGPVMPGSARAQAPQPCQALWDDGDDGSVETIQHFTYEDGRLVIDAHYDADAGAVISVTELVYDQQGRVWGRAMDVDGDGFRDRNVYLAYDNQDRLSAEAADEGPDGRFDSFIHYSYGVDRRFAAVDFDADWVTDRFDDVVYTRDEHDRLIREDLDQGADGKLDSITSYLYDDSDDFLTTKLVDDDADGDVDLVIEFLRTCD